MGPPIWDSIHLPEEEIHNSVGPHLEQSFHASASRAREEHRSVTQHIVDPPPYGGLCLGAVDGADGRILRSR